MVTFSSPYNPHKKAWMAKILGTDAEFGVDRWFIGYEVSVSGDRAFFELSETGLYQYHSGSGYDRPFFWFDGEQLAAITNKEAKTLARELEAQRLENAREMIRDCVPRSVVVS